MPTATFPAAEYPSRDERDRAMALWLTEHGVSLVVLAGFMELLSSEFLAAFERGVINVHPALLPAFPGLDAIGRQIEHGVKVGGVTVHYVDEGIDTGPIIAQVAVPFVEGSTRTDVERAVHAAEHRLLPDVIRLIAKDAVRQDGVNPRIVHVHQVAT